MSTTALPAYPMTVKQVLSKKSVTVIIEVTFNLRGESTNVTTSSGKILIR